MKRSRASGERGSAILIALLTTLLLGSIGAALTVVTSTETLIAGAHRHAEEAAAAAEAAFELALHDLAAQATWSSVLAPPPANITSTFVDHQQVVAAPDGRPLDLARLTADRQRDSDAAYGAFGADSPRWRLFLHSPLQAVLPSGTFAVGAYLVAWVADDGGDGDGDPAADANGRILVHAEAYGAAGARRAIEGAIGRSSAGGALQVLSWRELRR